MNAGFFLALSILAALFPTPLGKRLHQLCARMESEGWTAPVDPATNRPAAQAEMQASSVLYMCTLAQKLKGAGPGRSPDLQAALSSNGEEDSVIFSASVWCAGDQAATLDVLARQVNAALETVPPTITAAIRSAKQAKVTVNGLTYEVSVDHINATACSDVKPGGLGPVFMKLNVSVTSSLKKT